MSENIVSPGIETLDDEYTRIVNTHLQRKVDPRFAMDGNLFVIFHNQPVPDEEATAKEGRPIFKVVEHVRIMVPGDKGNIVDREIWPQDKIRFQALYKEWKETRKNAESGTPLEAWPRISTAQVEELKFFHVRTVEHLANMSDEVAQKFMAINALRQDARDYLKAAKDGAHVTLMRKELTDKDAEIANLTRMLKEQGDRLEKLERVNRR